jgi:hypothetical protein
MVGLRRNDCQVGQMRLRFLSLNLALIVAGAAPVALGAAEPFAPSIIEVANPAELHDKFCLAD